MIRGSVEIYSNNDLLFSENNLIVDGAGETIADFMTLPPDASGASSAALYDTSNYTIAALSFGKDESLFLKNGHSRDRIPSNGRLGSKQVWVVVSSTTTSSVTPDYSLPQAPNPRDTKLINFTNENLLSYDSASSVYANTVYGQLVNPLPYYTLIPSTVFGFDISSLDVGEILACGNFSTSTGGTPDPGLGAGSQANFHFRYDNGTTNGQFLFVGGGVYASAGLGTSSILNEGGDPSITACMDVRGYVRMSSGVDINRGVVLSSIAGSPASSTGQLVYVFNLSSDDCRYTALYGGITSMGLWTINARKMASEGKSAPFRYHPYNNLRDYRLFAKKVFNDNILKHFDGSYGGGPVTGGIKHFSTGGLTIIWRLYFL